MNAPRPWCRTCGGMIVLEVVQHGGDYFDRAWHQYELSCLACSRPTLDERLATRLGLQRRVWATASARTRARPHAGRWQP